jgi:hypothetical protein
MSGFQRFGVPSLKCLESCAGRMPEKKSLTRLPLGPNFKANPIYLLDSEMI